MQQRSKFIQRTSALALAAVLALGMGTVKLWILLNLVWMDL